MSASDFTPDPNLQLYATKAAEVCVRFVRHKFGKTADYTEDFVAEIESILDLLQVTMPQSKPSDEDVGQFCEMFGSYLGETYRRNRGGEWGSMNSEPGSAALSVGAGYKCFPWARVYKRLTNGEEDNVRDWYFAMIRLASNGGPPPLPPAKSPPPLPVSPPPLPG